MSIARLAPWGGCNIAGAAGSSVLDKVCGLQRQQEIVSLEEGKMLALCKDTYHYFCVIFEYNQVTSSEKENKISPVVSPSR